MVLLSMMTAKMMICYFIVSLLFLLVINENSIVHGQLSLATQASALIALKNGFSNFGSDFSTWKGSNPCNWRHISCNTNNQVTYLSLYDYGIRGIISSEIGILTGLKYLDLSSNDLTGTIPPEITLLTNVSEIYLEYNQLRGSIPSGISNLSSIVIFYFFDNELTGTIPSGVGLLSNLQDFEINTNKLSGTIPTEIGRLSNLIWLYISYNNLDGTLPTEIALLSNLELLDFDSNEISGTIPTELGKLSNLVWFYSWSNKLDGPLPSEIGLVTKLQGLDLSNNQFTGTLPLQFSQLINLESLFLEYNFLRGSLPREYGNLTNLQEFYVYVNQLTGKIPIEFRYLTSCQQLDLRDNAFTGKIPSQLAMLTTMNYLSLSENQFTGTLASEFGEMVLLTEFNVYINQLTGKIPSEFGLMTNLVYLFLDDNKLTGTIPTEFGNLFFLLELFVESNDLTGPIPTQLGELYNMTDLVLNDNYLNGSLPSEIGNIGSQAGGLRELNLYNNFFYGSLPSELGLHSKLWYFGLYNNNFSSQLPSELGLMTQLYSIEIFYNSFTGTLPYGWHNFTSGLNTFYANVNNFNDVIPQEWNDITIYNLDISNSGLICEIWMCQYVHYWNTQTIADSFFIVTEPTSSFGNNGAIAVTPILQVACYTCCAMTWCSCSTFGCCSDCNLRDYNTPVVFPSIVITATVEPYSLIKDFTGGNIGSDLGMASFSSLQFIGQPNVTYTIKFTSPGLKPIVSAPIHVAACETRQPNSIQDPNDPYSCTCSVGYFFSSTGKDCFPCPANTYKETFSEVDDFQLGQSSCLACPSNSGTKGAIGQTSIFSCLCDPLYYSTSSNETSIMGPTCVSCKELGPGVSNCYGGNKVAPTSLEQSGIEVASGYWITVDTDFFYPTNDEWFFIAQCPQSSGSNCPGGVGGQNCSVGYTGIVCGSCASGYGKLSPQICDLCPNKSTSSFLAFLVILIAVIGCILIVYFSVPRANSPTLAAKEESVIDEIGLKITITHLQIIGFTGNFKTQWPTMLTRVFAIPSAAATLSSSADNIAINCAINPSLYARGTVYFILPFILTAGVFIGYVIVAIAKGLPLFNSSFFLKVRQGSIALLYVAHPGIVQGLMKSILCFNIGIQKLAMEDMTISCHSSSFKTYEAVTIAYLIIYGMGGLLLVYHLLKREKDDLTFKFLADGYTHEMNHWDLVCTAKKIILAVISLFAPAPLQLFFTVWVLLISGSGLRRYKPYAKKIHKLLDQWSTWVLIFTVTVGMLYYSGIVNPSSTNGFGVSLMLMILNFGAVLTFLFRSTNLKKFAIFSAPVIPVVSTETHYAMN